MAASKESFEIQVFQTDHWVTSAQAGTEREAQKIAAEKMANPGVGGIRIVREWVGLGGRENTKVIHEQMKEAAKDDTVRPSAIEEAAWCDTADELVLAPARLAISRVLRQWLDKQTLTPTELIYNFRELKKAMDYETLVPASVGKIAAIHARDRKEDQQKRNARLWDLINDMAARIREANQRQDLPEIKDTVTLTQAWAQLQRAGDRRGLYGRVVLARKLTNDRSWLGKLEWLLAEVEKTQDAELLRLLDEPIADLCTPPEAMRDLLGRQPDLARAMITLIELVEGRLKADGDVIPSVTETLSRLCNNPSLPETRTALLTFLSRQLGGRQKLTFGSDDNQSAAYRDLIAKLMRPTGFGGGPEVAAAVALGYQRFVAEGGQTGRRNAVMQSCRMFESLCHRVIFICSLLDSALGKEFEKDLLTRLDDVMAAGNSMDAITPPKLAPHLRLSHLTGAWRSIQAQPAVPDARRERYVTQLAGFQDGFLAQTKLLDRLDDGAQPLRLRVLKLAQLAASGALFGAARQELQARLTAHTNRGDFSTAFTADLATPEEKQKALASVQATLRQVATAG
ncbi:MAG: hypothetical protein SF002_14540 [Alphaproteobacteria bacterium]|nr:hypothetical protein [Alphaproteobacteria bacterium]